MLPRVTRRSIFRWRWRRAATHRHPAARVPLRASTKHRRQPPFGGRGPAPTGVAAARFETLAVQTQAAAAARVEPAEAADTATRLLLPPGISTEAPTEALAINGNIASIDRGMMNDRFGAIGRGEFDPSTGEFGHADSGRAVRDSAAARTGRVSADAAAPAGWAAAAGPAALVAGGGASARRPRRPEHLQHQSNYSFGGSALDSAPYQLRPDIGGAAEALRAQHFGVTFGGPLIIPGVYNGDAAPTSPDLQRQPRQQPLRPVRDRADGGDARGRLLAGAVQLIDPVTGLPFPGNQIPAARIDPASHCCDSFLCRTSPAPAATSTTRPRTRPRRQPERSRHPQLHAGAGGRGGPAGAAAAAGARRGRRPGGRAGAASRAPAST